MNSGIMDSVNAIPTSPYAHLIRVDFKSVSISPIFQSTQYSTVSYVVVDV